MSIEEPSGNTIFGKIIRREIPASVVYETDNVLAFKDVSPVAPTHILLIPKKFIKDIASTTSADHQILGELLVAAAEVARREGLDEKGYRIVINTGKQGGQTVFHLHLHLLGGRSMEWPPG